MWQCSPTSFSVGDPASRVDRLAAASIEKPNFESAWPVEIAAWVSPATSGRDPDQHVLTAAALGGDLGQAPQLVEGVEHHVADSGLQRLAQLGD